ncbi:AzlD domain-containing protein [Companilactobacillus mishanensis]|uniref:AzlD domain-containing protein n=1 Tax=Companilactobacillus mishanensis TaxID=2486008 RepID=A0A5P0ZK89_9LACO|nr:AzlD domain-containing protein [Companilactobacillus mishanensis]MQS46068.1 AzlD domain-containing protein [Companilactobacillus mishanensis]MQS53484.1 AzlD domain-containing protein [Companilactobacillus mishanensis]MQS88810.1 AzlD domain-containing protein [Companilactobacillus mishanensis]
MISERLLVIILGCGLVTFIPRITPFIIGKFTKFPKVVVRFLEYLPLSILGALMLETAFTVRIGQLPLVKWDVVLAMLPTVGVAVWSKDLMKTVVVGIVTMAIIRLFM